MMAKDNDFSGRWHFVYWYPSNHGEGEEKSQYQGSIVRKGSVLIFESEPTQDEGYIFSRLSLDGDLASGTWHERTSPQGFFKGMEYSGAGQLLFDRQKMEFKGMWAGIGLDRQASKPKIYTGRWEIRKA